MSQNLLKLSNCKVLFEKIVAMFTDSMNENTGCIRALMKKRRVTINVKATK